VHPDAVPTCARWTPGRRRAAPWISAAVIAAWVGSAACLLTPAAPLPAAPATFALLLFRTWLQTGLFIVAHDALHGSAAPNGRRLNDALGAAALALYAFFTLRDLRAAHEAHHAAPRSDADPDGPGDAGEGFARWYARFVRRYVTPGQVLAMALLFNVARYALGASEPRLLAFWVAPALLSSLQLFCFGTWLPHRTPPRGFADALRATSARWGAVPSLLASFHFGYHWEHHAWPSVPWWRLPAARRARLAELVDAEDAVRT